MKYSTYTVLFVSLLISGCKKKPALILDQRYENVLTIMSTASCEGPNGKYSTTVHSAHDYVYFDQDYSYRNEGFRSIVKNGEGVVLDSSGNVSDTMSLESNFTVRSHDFIRIALKPQEFFSHIVFEGKEPGKTIFQAADELGNNVLLHYSEYEERIEGFVIQNPGDTNEQIAITYTQWEDSSYGSIPQALEIDQGQHSRFTFQFDEILINSKTFKPAVPENIKQDFVLSEPDLIPEGTSYNAEEQLLYIGAIYKQKILGLDKDGVESVIVPQQQFGKFSPLGIFYDPRTEKIWACVAMAPILNREHTGTWETTIQSFDSQNGKLIKEYQRLFNSKPILLNDLTVTENGTVYATESMHNRIYRISEKDSLELFMELEKVNFPNGITHKDEYLFIATDQGILRVNVLSKNTQLLKPNTGVDATVIDGLEILDDYFIGHQSTKVSRFFFNKKMTVLTHSKILDDGKELDSSTTGAIHKGDYYFIVNSQLQSGIDQNIRKVKPLDSLENIIIRKIKL